MSSKYYKVFYQELVARASNYPEISFNEIYIVLQSIQKHYNLKEMQKAFFELSFQLAIINQSVKLLKGFMCRAVYMDFLTRLGVRLRPKDIQKSIM